MNTIVSRRSLLPALLSFALPAALAQVAPDTITVTATRTPLRVSDVIAEVTVLDRQALDRATGRTLVELLAQQSGLQSSSNGGLGKTSSIFIRGLEARHTLLLVDGVRIGSATVGTPSLDNLPLEAIDHIEIVRGPMSSLYGNGAMGGVIQVVTRRGTQGFSGNAKLTAGSNDYGQIAGGVAFGNGLFDVAAQVQHTETQGISATNPQVPFGSYNPDRDGFRQNGGSLRLGWQPLADWRLELLTLQSKGVTGVDDGPDASAQAGLETSRTSLSASGGVMPGWRTHLSLSDATDGYETLSSASPFATLGTIRTRQQQLGWQNTLDTPVGTVLALAEQLREKVSRPGQPFDVSERHLDGLALGLSGSAAGHVWQGSLRRDRNSQFGGANTGAIGYGYHFTPVWRAGASYGTSFVAPSFNQLYFPKFGSPTLQPETGKHAELSLQWTQGEQNLRAAYYRNQYRGFITSGPQPVNLPKAEISGITLAYTGRALNIDWSASYDHTDPRNATVGNGNYDKQLPRRAKDMLRLAADWQAGPWSAGASVAAFARPEPGGETQQRRRQGLRDRAGLQPAGARGLSEPALRAALTRARQTTMGRGWRWTMLLWSCWGSLTQAAGTTLVDDRGHRIELPAPPQRVVSLLPSLTETVCALQACARLVGVDRYSNFPPSVQRLPQLGGLEDTQIERIVALKPDLVLVAGSSRAIDRLEALGLRVVVLEPKNLQSTQQVIEQVARALGDTPAGPALWQRMQARIAAAAARVPQALRGRKVYFEVSSAPYAASESSFVGETLSRLGMGNVVPAALGPFPKLNPEFVVRAQPGVVMASARALAEMALRPGWTALKALQDRRSCGFAAAQWDTLVRAGPRLADGAEAIADCLQGLAPR